MLAESTLPDFFSLVRVSEHATLCPCSGLAAACVLAAVSSQVVFRADFRLEFCNPVSFSSVANLSPAERVTGFFPLENFPVVDR